MYLEEHPEGKKISKIVFHLSSYKIKYMTQI